MAEGAKRADLGEAEQVEYDRLTALLGRSSQPEVTPIFWATFLVPAAIMAAGFVGSFSFVHNLQYANAVLNLSGAAAVYAFVQGLAAAIVVEVVTCKRLRRARAALLAAAVKTPEGKPRGESSSSHSRYPVTGTYNPRLYYERGGRQTAAAMEAWGYGPGDYDVYESNRPD